ncbi:beta-lactamase/transpeptidase-like protein [Glonium stellatum]|uniref:Beta-lactamase/transpeptidase-like protein n=1 Tax=Glonium stellatum TaxID=574774 RepID=A0A8E2FCW7_9PEZI|nr:beta-lactamase/transpeptidase-like protein [Glonium stellatum]
MGIIKWAFSALIISVQLLTSTAVPNCPLIGPEFPNPRNLSTHAAFQAAIKNLTDIFNYIDTSNTTSAQNFSYSVQVFSTDENFPTLFEHHHTASNLRSFNSSGVRNVGASTVYRLGSVTKVFTVLAFLAEVGDTHFNEPITKFVPELANATKPGSDVVRYVNWEEVTIGGLASQMAGIGRDYGVLGEVTQSMDVATAETFRRVEPGHSVIGKAKFFDGVTSLYPSFPVWDTPAYSNIAYQILAYALENMTGKSFPTSLYEKVLTPLNLTNTYYWVANESVGVVPGTVNATSWNVYLGDACPSGNMFSSTSDMSAVGRAILSSKILSPALTRRWLNPVAYTSVMEAGVGSPWGVRRIRRDGPNPYRFLTAYNKAGSIGSYTSLFALIKDLNIGFTVLIAGTPPGNLNFDIADILGGALFPALDTAARDEALAVYGGTYTSNAIQKLNSSLTYHSPLTSNSSLTLNSSLTINTDPDRPGLGVDPWISNGTDMVDWALRLQSFSSVRGITPQARLYYTGLETVAADGSKKQAFKAVFEDVGYPSLEGRLFSTDCGSWVDVTGVTYGSLPLDQFIFHFNSKGNVVSVENVGLRVQLYKTK